MRTENSISSLVVLITFLVSTGYVLITLYKILRISWAGCRNIHLDPIHSQR